GQIRTFRVSLNLLGDGFVEATPDQTFVNLAKEQCNKGHHKICGQALYVPIIEAPGQTAVGRFGWKDQQASLLSFAADAYLNEMGITTRLQPDEVTKVCDTIADPEDNPGAEASQAARARTRAPARGAAAVADIDRFARFMRATKAPARDTALANTPAAQNGARHFDRAGCATCHVRTHLTAPAGTRLNGGAFTVPN